MADESEGGIDKQKILDEIVGFSTPSEPALPPVPSEPPSPAGSVGAGAPAPPPTPLPATATVSPSEPSPPRVIVASPGERRRRELAGLVMVFVGVVWLAVGLAVRQWAAGGLAVLFVVPGILAVARAGRG